MKITDIREAVVPIASPIRNAFIDFSKMTASVVAVVTDVVRDGKPVIGYGFNSNGRYAASGLLDERFLPRLREADPATLLTDARDNLDPHCIWATLMTNEKPGGHGERSVAVGVIDMAVLGRGRQDRREAALALPRRDLRRRPSRRGRLRLRRRWLLLSRQGRLRAPGGDAPLPTARLPGRQD